MNQLNNTLFGFVDKGTDEALVKSLDKTKLVQKEVMVRTKNGIIKRKQWVKAGQDQPKDKPIAHDEPKGDKPAKKDDNMSSRVKAMQDGDSVTYTDSVGDNHTAVKKDGKFIVDGKQKASEKGLVESLEYNFSNAKFNSKQSDKPAKKDDNIKASPSTPDDSQPKQGKVTWKKPTNKQELVQLLASGMSREEIMANAEKEGITWKKSDHAGINWMRANMAIMGINTRGKKVPEKPKKPEKYSADEFKEVFEDKVIEHLKSGDDNGIALQVDPYGDVGWGILYDKDMEQFISDSGSGYPDVLTESEVRKLVAKHLKDKIGKPGVDMKEYFIGNSAVVKSLPEPISNKPKKYSADEFKEVFEDKVIEHLKSEDSDGIALIVDEYGDVEWGVRYDKYSESFIADNGQSIPDSLTESQVRKLVAKHLKNKIGKPGVDMRDYFLGNSSVVGSLPRAKK